MGFGDVLMSMGEARALHKQTKQPVMIVGRDGRPIASDLFAGIPYIIQKPTKSGPFQRIMNGPGVRPYIAGKTEERWSWRRYKPQPAQLVFTDSELEFAERYRGRVMIEPNTKAIGHGNKAWPSERWTELVAQLQTDGVPLVQCLPDGHTMPLTDTHALTPSFRYAAAVLSVCRALVATEGGLMHAAAAVGVPGVILWSEFISPETTGYDMHRNLRHAGKPCGMRVDCDSCRRSMEFISVTEVVTNLKEILNGADR
jgi:hypothetical protein